MTPDQLNELVARKRRELDNDIGAVKHMAETGKALQAEIAQLKSTVDVLERAAGVLAKIGEDRQKDAQEKIESLVTQGLRKIFGEELSFHVIQSLKGRTPVVEFVIRSTLEDGTVIETGVIGARGGGVTAVVGFLLRLVVLLLSSQGEDVILVLDETFAHVSDAYLPRLAEFLKEIVEKSKVQIIMVTHQPVFAEVADKAYRFSLGRDGMTKVREL